MRSFARSRRAYRWLLRLLPRESRECFGQDLEQVFVERLREAGGPLRRMGVWMWGVIDLVGAGTRERWDQARGRVRDMGREGVGMESWLQDLRHGVRALLRRPGFTAVAVVTLALGMGANVAIFSVVHGVLLSPLPFPDADRLVTLYTMDTERGVRSTLDPLDIERWEAPGAPLQVVGYQPTRPTLTGLGDPEVIQGARVTSGLFTLMGYTPTLGRDLTGEDDVVGGASVVVISHSLWTERFGRDPDVLGRTLELSGSGWEIVGVGPEGFDFPGGSSFWTPRRSDTSDCGHGCRLMPGIGKIGTGVSIEAVQAELDAASRHFEEEFPDEHRDDVIRAESLLETQVADVKTGLWILLGAVGMVLLIACANVANLLLVRASERSNELAVRATLGASRMRIVRQLAVESLVLAAAAGGLGVLLAGWGTSFLVELAPESLPRAEAIGLDLPVLGFAGAIVLTVSLLFGTLPAWNAAGRSLAGVSGSGVRTAGRRGAGWSRSLLLSAEIALSLSLLLGAGLLMRTLQEIRTVDLGFATAGVERFRVNTPSSRYDGAATAQFHNALEERIGAVRGVDAVGIGFGVPLASGSISADFELLDRPPMDPGDLPEIDIRPATPGFLAATGTPLLQGRWFERSDRRDTEPVAVINQAAARAYYPGTDPMGKQLKAHVSWGFDDEPARTIVGIVGDVRTDGAIQEPAPALYMPNAQFSASSVYVSVALSEGTRTVLPEVRAILRELDPALAATAAGRIEDDVREDQAGPRFYFALVSGFSFLALVLAGVGLYGVVAYSVSRRTREIGVRIALGARLGEVTSMVVKQGVRPALVGVVTGLAASFLWTRLLGSLLYGVRPQDPWVILGATGLLTTVVLLATIGPARRASKIPPASALQAD